MKKIISIFTIIFISLFLLSCENTVIEVTHEQVFDSILIGFEPGDSSVHVTHDIELPTTTSFPGVKLSWLSANETMISHTGKVNRPNSSNTQVLLILEVVINGVKDEKNFLLTVIATDPVIVDTYYTVTFYSNGGSSVTSLSIKENSVITKPKDPIRNDYLFDGWFKDSELKVRWNFTTDTVKENISLYASWLLESETFNVTFETNEGTVVAPQLVTENNKVIKPSDPTKLEYIFEGWFKTSDLTVIWDFETDMVTEDITIYAKWTPILKYFDVYFESNGGTILDSLNVEENTKLSEPISPTRESYVFNGWYKNIDLIESWNFGEDTVTNDLTLYASWYPEGIEPGLTTYQVSFETNGGSLIYSEIVLENSFIFVPDIPIRENYSFEGWYKDVDLTMLWDFENDLVTENIVLYSAWKELPPKLGTPIHGIGHQPRPVAHIAIGPYENAAGNNGGFTGYGFIFTNNDTNEKFVWKIAHTFNAGFATNYTEANLLAADIVLSPGQYKLEYYAMGNGVTTRDSDVSFQTVTFVIEKEALAKPILSINLDDKLLNWDDVHGATNYEVYINGELQSENTSPYDLSNLTETGIYKFKVIAKSDNFKSSESEIDYAVANDEAPKLSLPSNFSLNGFMLTWDAVNNAIGYSITINSITKNTSTNAFDLISFDIGNQIVDVKVIALGNVIDYANSDEANYEAPLPTLLPRLNPMAIGDQNGDVTGFGTGNYRLLVHIGHPPFAQEDWNRSFKFVVKKDGISLGEVVGPNMFVLHNPGSSTDFYGSLLTSGEKYTIEISLIAKPGSGHRDSLPLVLSFTFIK